MKLKIQFIMLQPFLSGDLLYTSEFDVCRRKTYKEGSRAEIIKILLMPVVHNIGILMKRKELTKTFMIISNRKNPFALHGVYTDISAL